MNIRVTRLANGSVQSMGDHDALADRLVCV
jgi:hypothetical protein